MRGTDTPSGPRRVDVGRGPLLDHRAADDPGVGGREENDQHQHRGPIAAADHTDDDDGDQRPRQRDHEIDPAHDDRVEQPPKIAGEQPEHRRDGEGADGDHEPARRALSGRRG